jgi:aspartyl-tRNA(Asn)/glutamyl-tRNA(Gln) amidotransferase subunit A
MGIKDFNKLNEKLNAFITVGDIGDIGGIRVAVKDNFCTKGMLTTAASRILSNFIPPYDATVVGKIKSAGQIIIGKTNMDAFAHGSSTETSDFGVVKNPWDLTRVAGGSSGGSAAAVAAGMCDWALGSETAGSIRGPAAWCGVVGLKPTYGRVSRYGLIAMCSSTDCPGPIAPTVAKTKEAYDIIKGVDPKDATTQEEHEGFGGYENIEGLKIGLPKEYFAGCQKEVNKLVLEAAKVFDGLGAKLVEVETMDPKYAIAVYTVIQRSEVSSNLARMDGVRFGLGREAFNEENARRIMLGTHTLQSGYYDAYYKKAEQVRTLIIEDFEKLFAKVDLLLSPTMPTVAPKIGVTEGQAMYGEMADVLSEASSLAGLPAISIPCGFIGSLPVGMQIISPKWGEELILNVAEKFEEKTEWHERRPKI